MTTVLLDTHTVLWFWWDDPRLSPVAKAVICDPQVRKLVSLVTPWEVAIKVSLNKLDIGCLIPRKRCNLAVFTNQTCDATQGRRTPEGVQTRTLWGELALQLGGVELYKLVESNDQGRAVPQGLFVEVLRQAAPCLILLDELADYCVGAMAVAVGDGTLADQTVSFVQQLTEAAAQAPGAVIVATLPASHLEVASSDKGQETLVRLEKRFGRMTADLKPVADEEITEVVRRRLFEKLGEPAVHNLVADAFMRLYAAHKNEVPPESSKAGYRDRLLAAYPFHPALIDTLYLRWGSHGDFQRTHSPTSPSRRC